ncbi:MAG TPA: alpha/beta hydrolase [Roseiarcus sp.]
MNSLTDSGRLELGDSQLEYRFWRSRADEAPSLVLLHEGLGCVGLWGDFPARLAEATGRTVFAYSRAGYGGSSTVALPRPLDYMQREAKDNLPRVLDEIGFERGALVGHSDGASIGAIYAGALRDPRVRAVSLIAPHFIVEEMTVAAIERAREAYAAGDLRRKLMRWHADVDVAFRGWNDAWLDPKFREWDITAYLPAIAARVQIIQGEADPYGSARQIDVARKQLPTPPDVVMLPDVGHAPHREAPEATLEHIGRFVLPLV